MPTSCKLTRSSTLQFPNSHILNHRIVLHLSSVRGATLDKPLKMTACSLPISELG